MKMEIARNLILKGCVKFSPFSPFIYASGLKGPIYCDNRLILSHVEFRDSVVGAFISSIESHQLKFDLFGGIATAGIPYAAFLADRLNKPMIYIRPKPKDHGKKNQIEGHYLENQSVVLVEDLINQGSSLADAMNGITQAKLVSHHCLSVVNYQMAEAQKRQRELGLSIISLTDFEHLLKAGMELNFLDEAAKKILIQWHADPKGWSQQ